jgi:LytR cell envelope-related transcriptional attenuator
MPGKHAPASPRSYYVSLARALGAALGAVALMVIAVVILLSRGGDKDPAASPAISPRATASTKSPSPRPSASPTVSPTATSSSATLAPSKVTVNVQNGTARSGLAKDTAAKIREKGYQVTQVNNAGSSFSKSTIFYRKGAKDEALAFQRTFPEFTVIKEATGSQTALLRVVIGADYP